MLRWVGAGALSVILWAASPGVVRLSGRMVRIAWLYVVTGAQG